MRAGCNGPASSRGALGLRRPFTPWEVTFTEAFWLAGFIFLFFLETLKTTEQSKEKQNRPQSNIQRKPPLKSGAQISMCIGVCLHSQPWNHTAMLFPRRAWAEALSSLVC